MGDEDILKYLEGQLSGAEANAFKKQMSMDESLTKQVASYREMKSFAASKVAETEALLAAQAVYKKQKEKLTSSNKPQVKERSLLRYLIPISVAALVLLGIFFTQNITAPEQNLYAEYFNPDDIGLVSRSDVDQSLMESAESQFNMKDFASAEVSFAKLIDQYPTQELYQFYHAISQLSNGKVDSSRAAFLSLTKNESFRNASLYYIGLSYVKQQNNVRAIEYLSQVDTKSLKYSFAQELIRKLQ